MKKIALFSLAALALSTAALAGPPKKAPAKKEAAKTKVACAVMGGSHKVDVKKATADKMYADHNGRRYFFCCGGCPDQFKADPAKFAKAESIPTPKAPAKKKG